MDKEFNRQIKRLNKKEQRILNRKENKLIQSKIAPIINQIQGKIPDKLKLALENAFSKGFQLVFEKGDVYIEKTYKKDQIKLEYDLNNYAMDKALSKKYIKRLDKQANYSKILNTSFTVLEGGVLGFFGIGLPDIPLFIAVIMRTIYEAALSYGYDYKSDEEKAYILLMICGAMSQGEKQKKFNEQINRLGNRIDQQMETEIDLKSQMIETAGILAEAMLVGKFVQGIPVVGVVGGVVNYTIVKKIAKYTGIKYKKRYLLRKARDREL
ncbi:MAG: EcsC family protein [Thermotaleaceae bacterium]